MSETMKQLVKKQTGRPRMARENRRWMVIRLNQDEQLLILDCVEGRTDRMDEDELRKAKILIGRLVAL